jgi:hypothetical protein
MISRSRLAREMRISARDVYPSGVRYDKQKVPHDRLGISTRYAKPWNATRTRAYAPYSDAVNPTRTDASHTSGEVCASPAKPSRPIRSARRQKCHQQRITDTEHACSDIASLTVARSLRILPRNQFRENFTLPIHNHASREKGVWVDIAPSSLLHRHIGTRNEGKQLQIVPGDDFQHFFGTTPQDDSIARANRAGNYQPNLLRG